MHIVTHTFIISYINSLFQNDATRVLFVLGLRSLEKFGQFGELRCLLYPVFEGCLPIVNCTGIDERMVDTCRPSTAMGIPRILPWRSPSQNRIFNTLLGPKRNHGLGNFLIIGTIEMGCLIYFNFRVMGLINGLWGCLCSLNFADRPRCICIYIS